MYSQAPLVLGGMFLSAEETAILAICYRLTQPLELVPGTLAQQLLPRFRRRSIGILRAWVVVSMLGAVAAGTLVLLAPAIESFFDVTITPAVAFLAIVCSLPVKFGNYILAAAMMARGHILAKLKCTAIVGIVIVLIVVTVGRSGGVAAVAAATPIAELLLMMMLGIYVINANARLDRMGVVQSSWGKRRA